MKRTSLDFYDVDNLMKIMKGVEKKGKLGKDYYPIEVVDKSKKLKELRREIKKKPKGQREESLEEILEKKNELTELKENFLRDKAIEISKGQTKYEIGKAYIRGHEAFVAKDITAVIITQIIKQELRRSYKLYPANRDMIVEQVIGLLDNPMAKVVIRADVRHFFESIPQAPLISKLEEDGFISKRTLKYLRGMLYKCNELQGNDIRMGIPRGLAFTSYLSELYMTQIDAEIKNIDGVYFYKRYVDDIIIIADASKGTIDEYWSKIGTILESKSLSLHEDSEKKYLAVFNAGTPKSEFDYLGYHFSYKNGKLDILMSEHRYDKYRLLIDAIFDIYSQCANFRKGKNKPVGERHMSKDALHQLFTRIRTLTSNGYLSGRKNYVSTGIYYSNKFITDLRQLKALDEILYKKIEDPVSFCPPRNLFNYSEENGYAENMIQIRNKLHEFSFIRGFRERKVYKKGYYSRTLTDLQHIYFSRYE